MRASATILAAVMVSAMLAGGSARAEDTRVPDAAPATPPASAPAATPPAATPDAATPAQDTCEVPSYLTTSAASLARVAKAIQERKKLDVLVVGSASSLLAGPDGPRMSYPARLEAALREKLSGVAVNVAVSVQLKKTAPEVEPMLESLAKERKPTLIVWQTGTADALKAVDPDDFRSAIDDGLTKLAEADTDVVLLNLQYNPRMETMMTVAPYLDNMRVGAEEHGVPLFDRFAMMRYWNESGRFDLFNTTHGLGLAKQVHDCLGRILAAFVIDAAHLPSDDSRVQH